MGSVQPSGDHRLRLRIAVLTYKRPQDIADALPRLLEQAASVADRVDVDIVVVDNDPDASARDLVSSVAAAHPEIAVHYENEKQSGISAARNRALATAAEHDLLVFIDDDERPSERWLEHLLNTYEAYGSAAVVGPVISEFEVELSPWVKAGRFFDRRRLPTGTKVDVAATNNLLLDLRQIRAYGLTFDARFGISGGGDTMFTRDLHKRGGELVWCDEAIVIDVVPAARTHREWVLKRALRSGTSWSSTSLQLAQSPAERAVVRARLSGRGAVRLGAGAARYAAGVVTRSPAHQAKGLRTLYRGAGLLSGAWGYVYQEYKR
jgi:glycosyltransferase involved in cell wall biosynthesis